MHTEQGNSKRLKEIYTHALTVKSAIPHPRIMGVIRECGGKMHARERQWMDAATAFFEAFKSYDEAGHPRRLQCLKYLVLAYMLNQSNVDPFNAQEAKPYKSGGRRPVLGRVHGTAQPALSRVCAAPPQTPRWSP